MADVQDKYLRFAELHRRPGAFVIPNPWDAGSARLLASLGFEALATTSAGFAFSKGLRDSLLGFARQDILDNAREIVTATDLPVSADLGDGFGADPQACAETIRLASAIGLVGGSIEDATGDDADPIYEFDLAVDRVRAAAEAAKDRPFLLTARCENYLYQRSDLDDTIRRLQAFSAAGADVLYAPGLPSLDAIRAVCSQVDKPVNVVMGLSGPVWSVDDLAGAGVARISVGGSMARAAMGALLRAAEEIRRNGTFTYAQMAMPGAEVSRLMAEPEHLRDRGE